jgi:hypothetical protein
MYEYGRQIKKFEQINRERNKPFPNSGRRRRRRILAFWE